MTVNNHSGSTQKTEKNALHNKSSQENIEKYMKGIRFPTEKKDLIDYSKKHSAPQTVLDDLNKLTDQKFHNQDEIIKLICH